MTPEIQLSLGLQCLNYAFVDQLLFICALSLYLTDYLDSKLYSLPKDIFNVCSTIQIKMDLLLHSSNDIFPLFT